MSQVVTQRLHNVRDAHGLKPKASAVSTMPAYAGNTPQRTVDWDPATFFWSSRAGKAGDTLTITFEQPVTVSSVEVYTGKLEAPEADCIVQGSLLVSSDGSHFRTVGKFVAGHATARLKQETIKAVQVQLDADHPTWIIIQDPILKE